MWQVLLHSAHPDPPAEASFCTQMHLLNPMLGILPAIEKGIVESDTGTLKAEFEFAILSTSAIPLHAVFQLSDGQYLAHFIPWVSFPLQPLPNATVKIQSLLGTEM